MTRQEYLDLLVKSGIVLVWGEIGIAPGLVAISDGTAEDVVLRQERLVARPVHFLHANLLTGMFDTRAELLSRARESLCPLRIARHIIVGDRTAAGDAWQRNILRSGKTAGHIFATFRLT